MSLSTTETKKLVETYKISPADTGSPEVQVSILTANIRSLTEHFKVHKKDRHSQYGLQKMVNKRRKLLKYLKRKANDRYQELIKRLELRDTSF
jgi:small subunit ribosomal protein S15